MGQCEKKWKNNKHRMKYVDIGQEAAKKEKNVDHSNGDGYSTYTAHTICILRLRLRLTYTLG